MLITALQTMLKFVLILGMIFGLAFMVLCTALVIICIVGGDASISISRHKAENE